MGNEGDPLCIGKSNQNEGKKAMAKSEQINSKALPFFRERVYGKSVFKNPEVLDVNYVPDTLEGRDDILTSLIIHFRRILFEKNLSVNCLLLGPAGSGKTTIAKFFAANFRQIALEHMPGFNVEYFNCIESRTNAKIISRLLKKYCYSTGRGVSSEEGWSIMVSSLKRNKAYLFIVLDEVHNLSRQSLLELLCLSETYGHQNSNFSFLLISREEDWLRIESEKILSRINEIIRVDPYTFESAYRILSKRGDVAFKEYVLSNKLIEQVSKIANETKNLRHGIDILRKCGNYVNERNTKKITLEIVKKASKDAYSEFRKVIDYLKEHELLTLYSMLLELETHESTDFLTTYQDYKKICFQLNIKPHVQMSFRKYERVLEKNNLLKSKLVRTEACLGKRKQINLIHHPNGIMKEIENYFERKYARKISKNEIILEKF